MFLKIVIFLAMFGAGIAILKYTEPIVRTFGKSFWAERNLGGGGSYTLWKLVAVVIMIVGFLYLTGVVQFGNWDNLGLEETEQNKYE